MNSMFLVMAGGTIGAALRHLAGRLALSALGPAWPWGTLFVNLLGGLLMGVLAGMLARLPSGEAARLFLGTGLLGGFTTFSAFSLDTVLMIERGAWIAALGYVFLSVVGAIAALAAGLGLVRSFA
ncbi:fluoride efflux transporter CrcB [Sphingomonas sp. NBWT7]|uniref:fluoride efflux transporter CrcB n=1 Tax=Sphingomonas sp. NBWT7 TaxID=2596913 RepID=UPI00162AF5FF|nr:fluoride efflux transporter CrcB [Sphingomonas sp. NBWT7]QNE31545.1 fluoride efflux transporter CrcB [Sphingomonas sp. NBWT7]